MGDGDRETPPARTNEIALIDGVILCERIELCGQIVTNQSFHGSDANRGYFIDTIFRSCSFTRCNFSRSDFEAIAFENCIFEDCNFTSADFRSVEFARCRVDRCDFSGGDVKATIFSETKLSDCSFKKQTFTENVLQGCNLKNVRFDRATVTYISFKKSHLLSTNLANCTSLYHFFEDCCFTNCRLNVDNIGLSFGLTRENLASLDLIWQGRLQRAGRDMSALLTDLMGSLATRRWGVAAGILAINFSLLPTLPALRLAFASIRETTEAGRPFRSDELKFLAQVVDALARRSDLPFLGIVEGLDCTTRAMELGRDAEGLRALALALKDAEFQALATWSQTWSRLAASESRRIEVEFEFANRPSVGITSVMEELHQAVRIGDAAPRMISSREGSYFEVVSTTVGTLMALVISLGLVARIMDHLVLIRGKKEVLFARRLPTAVRHRALEPLPSVSSEMMSQITACLSLVTAGHAPTLSSGAPILMDQLRTINVSPTAVAESSTPPTTDVNQP